MRTTVVFLALCLGLALAQITNSREFFQKHVAIQNDPIVQGTLLVDVTFDDLNTLASTNSNFRARRSGRMRLDYYSSTDEATRQIIFSEAYDFGRKFRWTFCPPNQCEALTYKSPMPLFYYNSATAAEDGWSTSSVDTRTFITAGNPAGYTCNGYSRSFTAAGTSQLTKDEGASLNAVDRIWLDPNNGNQICAARLRSGREFVFYYTEDGKNSFSTAAISDTSITNDVGTTITPVPPAAIVGPFNCPTPSCKIPLDLIFSLDESTSIPVTPEFENLKLFVVSIIQSLTISPTDVQVGANFFGYAVRTYMPLQRNATRAVTLIRAATRSGGATCISCGLKRAHDNLGRSAACQSALDQPEAGITKDQFSRATAIKAIIVITDGLANVNDGPEFDQIVANIRCDNITVYSIGVGEGGAGAAGQENLRRFTSEPFSDNSFTVDSYNNINSVLSQLLQVTCQEIVVSTCGRNCQGLCACNQQCLCPPSCDSADKCQQGTCQPTAPSLGCFFENLLPVCEEQASSDNCIVPSCDSAIGCVNTTKNCDDGNPCTYDYCDPTQAGGCINVLRTDPLILTLGLNASEICADTDICTVDTCTPSGSSYTCSFPSVGNCDACRTSTGNPVNCNLENFNPNWQQVSPCNPFVCDLTYDVSNGRYDLANGESVLPGPCKANPLNFEDANPCTINECIAVNGQPALNRTFLDCSSRVPDSCTIATCNPSLTTVTDPLDACETTPKDCNDGNACTIDTCFTNTTTGCLPIEERPQLDCVAIAVANGTFDECQVPYCDFIEGCLTVPLPCDLVVDIPAQCYEVVCDASFDPESDEYKPFKDGVKSETSLFPCRYIRNEDQFDDCNNCPPRDAECFNQNLPTAAKVGIITGGVLAAIIVVVLAVALGIGGGVGGYVYYKNRNNNNMANAQSSGIYEKPDTTGSSGAYAG